MSAASLAKHPRLKLKNKVNFRDAVGDIDAPGLSQTAGVDSKRRDLWETLKQIFFSLF